MNLEVIRAVAYTVVTILLAIFLYAYIIRLYVKQKKGITDYEKYANLALKDNLEDELIEPRESKSSK
ncbi:cytochrome c oxidase, cbb3-type, CcoQ subunit [Helicobacter sp. 12S02634-8]|uniref:cytochrome c oxidase, cbb3-type, CcoQ subunit n=1 Tax=Helicobacter sp. 12S02634-8 TaxID=1476199 RepID=UPI000BA60045|nr:cytochrome c oxidase, cbb3-type, CcoQ subunit [Helicobacter sp. 12S02634-8]PAF46378.1 cytochrome c oxidase, cbb3-type, CcoQ subunit [Helicobacter sp. 12S02634-8]